MSDLGISPTKGKQRSVSRGSISADWKVAESDLCRGREGERGGECEKREGRGERGREKGGERREKKAEGEGGGEEKRGREKG